MLKSALPGTNEALKLNLQHKSRIMIDEYFDEGLEIFIYKPQMTEEQRKKKDIEIRKSLVDIVSKSMQEYGSQNI